MLKLATFYIVIFLSCNAYESICQLMSINAISPLKQRDINWLHFAIQI